MRNRITIADGYTVAYSSNLTSIVANTLPEIDVIF